MKRLIFGVICASVLLSPINIYGREIQISDYRYTKCVHLMDGYTYCMNGERGEILNSGGHKIYSKIPHLITRRLMKWALQAQHCIRVANC